MKTTALDSKPEQPLSSDSSRVRVGRLASVTPSPVSCLTFTYCVSSEYLNESVGAITCTAPSRTNIDQCNQQYSIYALTDSSGNVSERYAYTAYGQPTFFNASATVQTSSASSNRYTYTAREWDQTNGLSHFRARWMSGLSGRFLTRDPIGYEDGLDLYNLNIEVTGVDPSGLSRANCTTTKDSFKFSIFDENERKPLNGRIPSLDGFANFPGHVRKRIPLPELDFQVDLSWETKACLEECDCNRLAMHFSEMYKFQFKMSMKGARIPVAAVPGTWIQLSGDIHLDVGFKCEHGGCLNADKRSLCFNGGGKIEFSYCGGVPSTLQGCIKATVECNVGGCMAVSYGTNSSGCKWKIPTEGCFGPLCRTDLWAEGTIF